MSKKLCLEEMTAESAHEMISKEASEKAVQEVRFIESIEVGKLVRQGDVYLHSVRDDHPHGEILADKQLAIGNSQGSRHVAAGKSVCYAGTQVPEWCARGTFLGPVIKSAERFTITHPEHAHVSLPPGFYQVTHQLDARSMNRVID